jgi:hypothetical protein
MATGRIHYITRQAEYAPGAEARILHQGRTAVGADREDLVTWAHANLPSWAQDDPVRYFSAAEVRERANGPAYEEWRLALPKELTLAEQVGAAQTFVQAAFGTTHPYVYAVHQPRTVDGTSDQTHCHVIWNRRALDGIERSEAQFFKKYNAKHPEMGGAARPNSIGHSGSIKAARMLYTDTMNLALEQAGHAQRLHPGRLSTRGFDREREPRALPSDSNKAKYRGELTDKWQQVLDHRARYAAAKEHEQVQAQDAWEERKRVLGMTPAMTEEERLARVTMARQRPLAQPTLAQLREEAQVLSQRIPEGEAYLRQVQVEHRVEQAYTARGQVRPRQGQAHAEQVLAQGPEGERRTQVEQIRQRVQERRQAKTVPQPVQAPGLLEGDEPAGPGLHVRLRTREKEQGYGW